MSRLYAAQTTVGRDEELDAIDTFVGGIGDTSRALFLVGPAGIGKTRLWEEGVARARSTGVRTLTCRATGADAQFAFAAVGDLLRDSSEEVLGELPPPQRRALAVALLLEEPSGRTPDHAAVASSVLAAFRVLSRADALLVAIDDVQWLDAPSYAVLGFAWRRIEGKRMGFLATVRATHSDRVADLVRALPEATTLRWEVKPLTVGALYELVRERFGLALPRPTLVRLQEMSGGNPFYALEIARLLVTESGDAHHGVELPLPVDLSHLLRTRLEALSPATRRVLLSAAALARPTRTALASAFGDIGDAVREAVSAEVVEPEPEVIRFAHPLFASVLYAEASATDRIAVHARLAQTATDVEEQARHAALAAPRPDADVAQVLDAASAHALSRGAIAAAAELAEHALRLTPAEHDARIERVIAAAEHRYAAGNTSRAVELLEDSLLRSSAGVERAELLLSLGKIKFEAEDTRVGRELCVEALEHVGDEDDRLRARILERLSLAAGGVVDFRTAAGYAEEAAAIARRVGDSATLARALARLGSLRALCGEGITTSLFEEAVRLEEELGGLELDYGPTFVYARVLLDAGDIEAARPLLERLCERGRATADAAVNWPLFVLGCLEFGRGNSRRAAELARESYDVAVQTGREAATAKGMFLLAEVEALHGDVNAARARAEQALVLTDSRGWNSGGPRGVLGLLEMSLENYEAAYDVLMPAVDRYRRQGSYMIGQDFEAVEALACLGRVEEGYELLAPSEAEARRTRFDWALAAAGRARGLLAAAKGDLEAAAMELEDAVRAAERAANPFEHGRTLLAFGTVERQLGRKQAARDTLGRALAIFADELEAPVWAERCRRELARIGGRASPSGSELSEMETRIAQLVVGGASNKQAAATLSVSAKTVEWNLSKIYRKLGVRSRAELAAREAAGKPGDSPW